MDLRQRERAARRRGISDGDGWVIRRLPTVQPDTRVRYGVCMSGVVDRAEWAKFVDELLDEDPKRKKAPLSRRLGISERTLDRWLGKLNDVSEASVRQVAERTGRNAMDLLIRVGVYRREEMPPPEVPTEDAWGVAIIESSTRLDAKTKAKLVATFLDQEKRDREEKERRLQEQIELIGGPES